MKIKGTEYPAKGGFKALRIYQESTGRDFVNFDNIGLSDIVHLFKSAMEAEALKAKKKFKLTYEDVENAIDDDPKLLSQAMKIVKEFAVNMAPMAEEAKKPTATR